MKKCMLMFILLVLTIIIATMSEKKDEKILSYSLANPEVTLSNSTLSQEGQVVRTSYKEEPSSKTQK
ncbi:hypothetical protein [Ulvibacterium marinum]|uniref:hypothetical protein n=1 Tax=Ulvibacterium marinum TaxID=2419782 RepID=UPI0011C44C1A|nr:hypothetical protein [Ulvibacterium marinum]